SNDLSKSENPASLNDNKFNFVWRSNAVCLQLFTKELEASPGQSAASSIISWHLNDPGSSTDNGQFQGIVRRLCCWRDFMIIWECLAICIHASYCYVRKGFASEWHPIHEEMGELQNPDEILQLYIKKHLGPNGSCPLSLYNYGLLSKSNIEVPKRLVSKENGYKFSKKVARKASQDHFCKSPVYHDCRIYANDGRLISYCDRRKLEWYLQRDLAKLVDEDPPAIMLLFEPKGQPEDEGNAFHIQSKKNICVGCGEGNHYLRHRIIPSCYWTHFPRHLKSYHDILLLCVDCHEKAHSFAEKYKNKVASDYGIPLFVHKVVNSSGGKDACPKKNGQGIFVPLLLFHYSIPRSSNVEEIERDSVSLLPQLIELITFFGSETSFTEFRLSE
ncbi:hypothetical protein Tco_0935688, partial [Tanacetum coccineum]